MRLGQRLNSFRNKKFDEEGLELRNHSKYGFYIDKEKEWGKLSEEISVIIDLYMFIYGIEGEIKTVNSRAGVYLQFIGLHHKDFIESLKKELKRVFNKTVIENVYEPGGSSIRIYLDSDLVL